MPVRQGSDPGALAMPGDALQQLRTALARDDHVLRELLLRHAADGAAHLTSRRPQLLALRPGPGHHHVERGYLAERPRDTFDLRVARALVAVHLDDQQRARRLGD